MIEERLEQLEKASPLMLETESGILIEARLVQPLKVL